MNSRYSKSQGPSAQSEEETSNEMNSNSSSSTSASSSSGIAGSVQANSQANARTAKLDAASGSDFHDDLQLEFSAILGTHATPSPEPHDLRKFMTEYTMCAMCDTSLEIRHETNSSDLKVKEEAYCPSCGIRVRSKHHLMH